MLPKEDKIYYVYQLKDPRKPDEPKLLPNANGKIFYVGKGKRNRIEIHEKVANKGSDDKQFKANRHLYSKIKNILKKGYEVEKQIIAFFDDEKEALALEQRMTHLYKLENLCNIREGGLTGSSISEETKKILSEKALNRFEKDPQSHPWCGKKHKKETIEKMKRSFTKDRIEKISQRWIGDKNPIHNRDVSGEKSSTAKLSNEKADVILNEYLTGEYSTRLLSIKHNLTVCIIKNIINQRTYSSHRNQEVKEEIKKRVEVVKKQNERLKRRLGENNPNAKITSKIADEIIEEYLTGKYTYRDLTEKYNISYDVISCVIKQRTYYHHRTKLQIEQIKNEVFKIKQVNKN